MKAYLMRQDRENYRIRLDNGEENTFRIPQDLPTQERKQLLISRLEENEAEISELVKGFAIFLA